MIDKNEFVKIFAQKCKNNDSAIFLGAGMSVDTGLPSWKQLFSPLAAELKIDINNTNYHLYDIAQFYSNSFGKNKLYKEIKQELNKGLKSSETLNQLVSMQCNSFWTTNFDCILENNLELRGKIANVISKESDLIDCDLNKNINIFKMNGDIREIENAVITKSDLEKYIDNHDYLLAFFKRELITKTFLFLGYSFTDSLVLPCISELSRVFNNNQPHHYTILKKSSANDFNNFVEDLEKRYQIDVVLIDNYSEIPDILKKINYYTNERNVFISGSCMENDFIKLNEVDNLCKAIAKVLYKNKFTIVNGYGYKVGYYIASEMTKMMIEENVADFKKYLLMYPFNEHLSDTEKSNHRNFMIAKSNVSIFMYGTGDKNSGMMEEYAISKEQPNRIIIPIASTGGNAKLIYDDVKRNLIYYPYLEKYMEILEKEKSPYKIAQIILAIINEAL